MNFFESKIVPLDPPSPKTPPYNQTKWIGRQVADIWPFEILSKMAAAAILDLFEPEIAPLDPPSPKTLP